MFKNNKSSNINNNDNTNNKKELNKTTIKVSIITLLLLIPLYSSYSNSCITKDKYGNIVYNTKSKNNKCLLIRSVNSNERNELTEYGKNKLGTPDSIGGGACIIDNSKIQSIILANGNTDNLEGKLINNNSNISISCKKGYNGNNIKVSCKDGNITTEGDCSNNVNGCIITEEHVNKIEGITFKLGHIITKGTYERIDCNHEGYYGWIGVRCNNDGSIEMEGWCPISGCRKYENNGFVYSYESKLDNINLGSTNTSLEELKNTNKDKIYKEGEVVDTITCRTDIEDFVYNEGYTIKCSGSDNNFSVEGRGCPRRSDSCFITEEHVNKIEGITFELGKELIDGSYEQINCNNEDYYGWIGVRCNKGIIKMEGYCPINGCRKYENNGFVFWYSSLLNGIDFSLTNTNSDDLKNTNKDKIYKEGEIVDIITCRTDIEDLASNEGYTIKCNGRNNNFSVEGRGCIMRDNACFITEEHVNKIEGITFKLGEAFAKGSYERIDCNHEGYYGWIGVRCNNDGSIEMEGWCPRW